MDTTLGRVIDERARTGLVGRDPELSLLSSLVEPDGALVMFVDGPAGIGKSALVAAFRARLQSSGATAVPLDGRAIEPTPAGFLRQLSRALGLPRAASLDGVAARLAELPAPVVLTVDTYERLRLLDAWLRREFVPSLPSGARLLLAGREPPVPAWSLEPGWAGLFRRLPLGPLSETESLRLAGLTGADRRQAEEANRLARGHPLTLLVAARTLTERLGAGAHTLEGAARQVAALFVADLDERTRAAVRAASVVRRVTVSLLAAMLPDTAPSDAMERLCGLPFVETAADGVLLHEAVQEAVAADFRATDPAGYRACRRAAWRRLREEMRHASRDELWRYTADMLWLVENPVVREAFFPRAPQPLAVEPAVPGDEEAVLAIARRHETPEAADVLATWWRLAPTAFHVVRDGEGVAGFSCVADLRTLPVAIPRADPVTAACLDHLRGDPVPPRQRVLLLRRWLERDLGDVPSPAQAATWLDVKRAYMELRPNLRRIYTTTVSPDRYLPVVTRLGFRPLPEPQVELGAAFTCVALDFGPASVDGWLARLADEEIGGVDEHLLDTAGRRLLLPGGAVPLTPLEFALMEYLVSREGRVCTRAELLADVWGSPHDGGSNVVDAVVRTLRRKLGDRAGAIESVRGAGYRFVQH